MGEACSSPLRSPAHSVPNPLPVRGPPVTSHSHGRGVKCASVTQHMATKLKLRCRSGSQTDQRGLATLAAICLSPWSENNKPAQKESWVLHPATLEGQRAGVNLPGSRELQSCLLHFVLQSKLWLALGNLTPVEGRVSHCESPNLPLFSITLRADY